MKKFSKILVLAPKCSPFIKGPLNKMANELDEINVLLNHNYLTEISRLPLGGYFSQVRKFSKSNLSGDWEKKPDNITIYTTSMLYFVHDSNNMNLGDKIFKKFNNVIEKNNIEFDLIDAHFTWPSGYVGAKLKEEYGVPLVVSARGYDIYELPFRNNDWEKKVKYALNSADQIITVSSSNLKCIEKLNIKTPVTVRPNGFDSDIMYPMDKLECRKKLNLPLDKKIILSVGGLGKVKGHEYLIKAMKIISKAHDDVICIIVGSGPLEAIIKKLIQSLGLEDYIFIVGEKSHKDISLWMNSADIFVLPSLNEGNPNVMFEAIATGLPFVGTKVGGVPEIITSNEYGILVEPGDYEDLAAKIIIALKKDWDNEKIINYANKFTWENIAKEIFNVYGKI